LSVIHGYLSWKPWSVCSKIFFSSPVHGWRRVIVTGVLSTFSGPLDAPPESPPPHPAAATVAPSRRSAPPHRLMRV
jgi:hypothetical protein